LALSALAPAAAGSNGQKFQLFNSTYTSNACVAGYNQNDYWVRFCWWLWNTGTGQNNLLGDYWYKYIVTIDRTDNNGTILATRSDCNVPVSQGPDYYACLAP
jgi:hypothetical protein